jgi:NADP-dependent 3-hydroxy acid dehydrogenase YdfG
LFNSLSFFFCIINHDRHRQFIRRLSEIVRGLNMTLQSSGSAIVTGGGGGLGSALARALALCGHTVLLIGRRLETLRPVAASLPAGGSVLVADLATEDGLTAVIQACPVRIDVLVHAAGLFLPGPAAGSSPAAHKALEAVNYHAPMRLTAACLPALRATRGQIVFVNSTAVQINVPDNGIYTASKMALRTATDALRRQVVGSGVRILSLYPGRTDTPMQREVLMAEGRPDADIPLLKPDDVADATMAALTLTRRAEITDLIIRPPNT